MVAGKANLEGCLRENAGQLLSVNSSSNLSEFKPVRLNATSFTLAVLTCAVTELGLALLYDSLAHWFLLPLFVCGVLCASDGFEWLRGRMDVYDPIGLIGLFGTHFFFLSPLLYVAWDAKMRYVVPPADWRPWLGGMAIFNVIGLLLYRGTRNWFSGKLPRRRIASRGVNVWELDSKRFSNVLAVALLVTLAAQVFVYARFGGVAGYIDSYEARHSTSLGNSGGGFAGMSYVFAISESFPILAIMGYAAFVVRRRKRPGWFSILLVLAGFFVLQMLFGGLRGSRSTTIFALVWAVGIVHFLVRPMPKKLLIGGVIALMGFMYVYGFYKSLGRSAVASIQQGVAFSELEKKSGRSFETVLLGDLSRCNVQAFFLYRLTEGTADFDYGWGRTYLGAVALLIPRAIWPERPPTKKKEGTELIHGRGRWSRGQSDTRVYGLAGEAMLNFGPYVIPLFFLIPAALAGRVRRWLYRWKALPVVDMRLLVLPFLVRLSFLLLSSDSSNLVFGIFKTAMVPALVVLLGSRRHLLHDATSPEPQPEVAWLSAEHVSTG